MTRIAPSEHEYKLRDIDSSDWGDSTTAGYQHNKKGHVGTGNPDKSSVRRRRRRSFEPGSDDYANYVEKRVFNKIHAWTPYLWQRKRDKRLMGNLNPTRGWNGWKFRQRLKWNSLKLSIRELGERLELWRDSLKKIEGHQGTGVVSYFVFLKFLLFLNIFIFLAMFIAVVFFQVAFPTAGFSKETTGYDDSSLSPGVALSDNCTYRYQVNDTSGFQLFLDFIQGTGWMETTSFFYGYYSNMEVSIPGGKYNIPLVYCLTTLAILVVSLIVMVHHTFSKYTDTLVSSDILARSQSVFFNSVLCGWDYRVYGQQPVLLQQKNMYQRLSGALEDQKHELEKSRSSRAARFGLWVLRILINIFIIALLVGSAAAIYFAQTFSSDFTTSGEAKDYHMIVQLFVQYLPSIIIAGLNAVYPLLFMGLVKLENYRPSVVIKITILRIVFVRLAALMVITLTIYVQITCSTHDMCYVGINDCPAIQCWETYFGQQIYKFFVTEFACDIVLTLLYELPRKLFATKCNCRGWAKKIGPAEFDIAISVLDLVYGQALCWLGFFFVPMLPILVALRMIILFYLKMLSALYNTVPPQKPYQAARSNAFFMIVLLITFFLVAIPMGYVLVELQPSPMCGPFRIYSKPTDIVDIQINLAADWLQTTWTIITSSAFITGIILLLGLALYYCSALRASNRRLIKSMKAQIMQDEKDKQYLVIQLSKYTDSNKPGPEPKLPPPTYTTRTNPDPPPPSYNGGMQQPDPQNRHENTGGSTGRSQYQQTYQQIGNVNTGNGYVLDKTGSPKGVVVQPPVNTPDADW